MFFSYLNFIIFILILVIFLLLLIPKNFLNILRFISVFFSAFILLLSSNLLIIFNKNTFYFQNLVTYNFTINSLNLNFSMGLDGISIFFFVLSSFLIFICLLFVWNEVLFKEYSLTLFILHLLLLLVFSVLDLLLFYIFFEAILIPMYLIIGIWGSRERKIRAVYLFFFYTLIGSLCLLLGIIYIYSITGTFDYQLLTLYHFSFNEQYWLWLAFFLSFASKIPMFPFHVWLPEAHVEAPTVGSVLLAGILLKLGVYGFLRFNLILFPEASLYFAPFVYLLSLIGIISASFNAIRQTDLKRIIAYSSIAHMNLVTLGIFSFNIIGLQGCILQSVSHGFVSGAMFLLIGILYERYHSRSIFYYGGLIHVMPIYSTFFLLFTMANISLPGTSNFIGEFLLLLGIFKNSGFCAIISTLSVVLCGAYSLWVYNRIIYGNLKTNNTILYQDINLREFCILVPIFLLVIFMGIYPNYFLKFIHYSSLLILNYN